MGAFINEKGNRYNRLLVVGRAPWSPGWTEAYWICECSCGSDRLDVRGSDLRSGHTTSCGCRQIEYASDHLSKTGKVHPSYRTGNRCGYDTYKQRAFHEKIRARDSYTCQNCGKSQEQELGDAGCKLAVRHINNIRQDNRDENAVTCCRSCHAKYRQQLSLACRTNTVSWLDIATLAEDPEAMAAIISK